MTGEQKPGGLEVVAWASEWDGLNGKAAALHADKHEAYDNAKWMNGQVVALTPAEPAEARIRGLEREKVLAVALADEMANRSTAAEAKLARFETAAKIYRDDGDCQDFRDALAALQEAEGKA